MEIAKPQTVETEKTKGMTSRERVLAALQHREPDRIPIDFSGHRSSGIAAIAYAKLRKHLGLPVKPVRVYDPVQQLAIVDADVLDMFGVDTIELGRAFALDDTSLGRLGFARRNSLPDARLGSAGARKQRMGYSLGQWERHRAHARRRAVFRAMLFSFRGRRRTSNHHGGDGRVHVDRRPQPAGTARGRRRRACARWPRAPARCGPAPIAPSWDCSAAIFSRSASSSTATTTS